MKKLLTITVLLSLTACAVPPGGYVKMQNPVTKQIGICMVDTTSYFQAANIPYCKKAWENEGFIEVPNNAKI